MLATESVTLSTAKFVYLAMEKVTPDWRAFLDDF
jgi:hypothetical protein